MSGSGGAHFKGLFPRLRIMESLMGKSNTMNWNLQMLKGFLEHAGDCKIPCHLTRTRPWGLFETSSSREKGRGLPIIQAYTLKSSGSRAPRREFRTSPRQSI